MWDPHQDPARLSAALPRGRPADHDLVVPGIGVLLQRPGHPRLQLFHHLSARDPVSSDDLDGGVGGHEHRPLCNAPGAPTSPYRLEHLAKVAPELGVPRLRSGA